MEFKEILSHARFTQVGFVVRDIEAAKAAYAKLFHITAPETRPDAGEFEITGTTIFGKPAPEANAKLAFIDLTPGVQLELIEPNEEPSVWRDAMEKYGEGIHHIAFSCENSDEIAQLLVKEFGGTIEQQGKYGDGSGQYIYVDCFDQLKCRIELLESFR